MKFPFVRSPKFDHHVNQLKKSRLPGKYLITKIFEIFFKKKNFFKIYLRWINMMMDEENDEESESDQYKSKKYLIMGGSI
jgi:hypothetical protein